MAPPAKNECPDLPAKDLSTRITVDPHSAALRAAHNPPNPPPMMSTSDRATSHISDFLFTSLSPSIRHRLPGHGSGFSEGMDIDGFHGACQFTTETGPAILGILDLCPVRLVHDDDIPGTEEGADTAPDTYPAVDLTNHFDQPLKISFSSKIPRQDHDPNLFQSDQSSPSLHR